MFFEIIVSILIVCLIGFLFNKFRPKGVVSSNRKAVLITGIFKLKVI